MKLLTFIVTVYNQEKYIEECVNSLLGYLPFANIVIVNDGSTDNSSIRVEQFKNINGISIIHQRNEGVSAARNRAIALVKTNYVTFVDGDDCIEDFNEEIVKLLKEDWDIIQYSMLYNWKSKHEVLKSFSCNIFNVEEYLKSYIKGDLSYSCCNKIFKMEMFEKHSFIEGRRYEDVCLLLSLADVVKKVKIVPYGKYLYRFNNLSFTLRKVTYDKIEDFVYMTNLWKEKICQYQISEYWKIRLNLYFLIEFAVFQSSLDILHLISPYALAKKECYSYIFRYMPFRYRCFLFFNLFVNTPMVVLLMSKIYKIRKGNSRCSDM